MADAPKTPWPKAEDVPSAAPLVAAVTAAKAKVAHAREAATGDGGVRTADPALRSARKRLKRAQRRLRRELQQAARTARPAAPEAAAEGAPAEATSEG